MKKYQNKPKVSRDEFVIDEYNIYDNPEKKLPRRLGDEPYMPLSTTRLLLSGLPGCGKRNLIMNIVDRMDPAPSCIHIVHCDPETTEYDNLALLGCPVYTYSPYDFPTFENIVKPDGDDSGSDEGNGAENVGSGEEDDAGSGEVEGDVKPKKGSPLVIVDEITSDTLGPEGRSRFERLVNHGCTHGDTTLFCSIQSLINLPAKVRRGFNHFALWKQNDISLNRMVSTRCGIKPELLDRLFDLCEDKRDFIYIDMDEGPLSNMRYRLNWMSPIEIVGHD